MSEAKQLSQELRHVLGQLAAHGGFWGPLEGWRVGRTNAAMNADLEQLGELGLVDRVSDGRAGRFCSEWRINRAGSQAAL